MKKSISNVSKEELTKLVKESYSYAEILRKLGYKNTGHTTTIKRYIALYDIDITHFNPAFYKNNTNNPNYCHYYTDEEIFVKNSKAKLATSNIKNRLILGKYIPYECELWGNKGLWRDSPLALQLDHRDGDRNNNEITNLRFLCPNCHAKTKNFTNKISS